MSLETYGWLVLAFPLAGPLLIALTWRLLPGRRTAASARSPSRSRSRPSFGTFIELQTLAEEERHVVAVGVELRGQPSGSTPSSRSSSTRSACYMMLIVSGVSMLIHLYSVAYMGGDRGYARFFAYLNFFVFCMLLLVLAGELLPADRRLGVRRRGLLPADLLLVPAHDRHAGRHQGVRHQRGRRRRPRARDVFHLQRHRPLDFLQYFEESARPSAPTTETSSRAACCCSSARSRSRPRCRCTPGSRTPWRARRRSPP